MGNLYLVRHAQASFGAANYDQLSELGMRQSQQLGAYWQERGMRFDAVYSGALQRHAQTLQGIAQSLSGLPAVQITPAWNEYDSDALLQCMHSAELPAIDTQEGYRAHFRLLCNALEQWMSGVISPAGMPSWQEFSERIRSALEEIRKQHAGGNVLVVSSGGPIGTAVSQVLGCSAEVAIALNMRVRNTAVSEFSVSAKRLMLQTFNTCNHLDTAQTRSWQSFT